MYPDAVLDMPPAAERTDMPPERIAPARDVSRLSLPVTLLPQIVITVLTVGGAVWALKADIQEIKTQQEAQHKIDALQNQLLEERMSNQREDMTDVKRQVELMRLQYQELRETIIDMRQRR